VTSQNCLDEALKLLDDIKPDFLIVDSIQAVFATIFNHLRQCIAIRECTNILMRQAKQNNITTVVIGHVTKGKHCRAKGFGTYG
jgi:DNA repair protein RadA/Sms